MKALKTWAVLGAILFVAGIAVAQPTSSAKTNQPSPSGSSGDLLQMLDDLDQTQMSDFFTSLQEQFAGTNIYEMGSIKAVALQVIPVLNQFEETEPYGIWLQAHLDDLDAADEILREAKAAFTNAAPGAAWPQPSPKIIRSIWVKQLANRPWPPLAKTYVPQLKPIFASERVPPALVWVAGVESSFDSRARSPAGAAGMFQLMPDTARSEHLSLWPFDQRYQPEKSARAAARYLRELHEHFGDWPLALAAYNAGQNRIDKLLKEHKAATFDEIAPWLPAETQMYVPKVEATIRLREGLALADLKTPEG
jgi:membrane-bound lytic murein transglycosylase D